MLQLHGGGPPGSLERIAPDRFESISFRFRSHPLRRFALRPSVDIRIDLAAFSQAATIRQDLEPTNPTGAQWRASESAWCS